VGKNRNLKPSSIAGYFEFKEGIPMFFIHITKLIDNLKLDYKLANPISLN